MQTPALISTACGPTCRSGCASRRRRWLPGALALPSLALPVCSQRTLGRCAESEDDCCSLPTLGFDDNRLMARSGIVGRRPTLCHAACRPSSLALVSCPGVQAQADILQLLHHHR